MTFLKLPIQLSALIFSLAYATTVFAEDTTINESNTKNSTTEKTVSTQVVNRAGAAKSVTDIAQPVAQKKAISAPCPQMKYISDMSKFQKMEKEWYQQRREAYRQYLENRNNPQVNAGPGVPGDAQSRREEYIKHMEQRRDFFNKLNEQRRKEFEQRRIEMQQKMHQTSTQPGFSDNS